MKTFFHALRAVAIFSLQEKKLVYLRGAPEMPSSGAPEKKEAPKKKNERGEKREKLAQKSTYERSEFKVRMERAKEAEEKKEQILFTYEYPLAESDVPDDIRKDELPDLRKDYTYRAIGGVDATSFDAKRPRDQKWFEDKCQFATEFAQLLTSQQIVSNFSVLNSVKSQHRVLALVNELALVENKITTGRFDALEFKKRLDSTYTKEELYGPEGIFNLMLAMKRAHEAVRGKTPGSVQYDLRIGQGRLSEASRVTQLREMRSVQEKPVPSSVAPHIPLQNAPGVPEKVKPVQKAKPAPAPAPAPAPVPSVNPPAEVTPSRQNSLDQTVDEREIQKMTELVMNEGRLFKDRYAFPKNLEDMTAGDIEAMALSIANEVVQAVRPPFAMRQQIGVFLAGKIRPHIERSVKDREANFHFEKAVKLEMISLVLSDMKTFNVERLPL